MTILAAGGIKVPDAEIAQVAYNAGFRGQPHTEIVARCWVECSGYADAINSDSGAAGLWQILPAAHPEYKNLLPPNKGWMDPQTNAKMAFEIWRAAGNSMQPWAADGSAWLVYVPRAKTAIAQINPMTSGAEGATAGASAATGALGATTGDPSGSAGTGSSASPASGLSGFISFVTNPHNYFRVAMFIGGGLLLMFALWQLIKNTSVGDAVKGTAKDVGVAALV